MAGFTGLVAVDTGGIHLRRRENVPIAKHNGKIPRAPVAENQLPITPGTKQKMRLRKLKNLEIRD